MFRRKPAPILSDADRYDFIFLSIDCVQYRRRREQRNFMLAAASAKKNAHSKFCHKESVWAEGGCRVNRRMGTGRVDGRKRAIRG